MYTQYTYKYAFGSVCRYSEVFKSEVIIRALLCIFHSDTARFGDNNPYQGIICIRFQAVYIWWSLAAAIKLHTLERPHIFTFHTLCVPKWHIRWETNLILVQSELITTSRSFHNPRNPWAHQCVRVWSALLFN